MTESTRLFSITAEEATSFRRTLADCDGEWRLAVRTGEDWSDEATTTLLLKSGELTEVGVDGLELGLVFEPRTTRLGDVATAIEIAPFTHLSAAGDRVRFGYTPGGVVDATPLSALNTLESLDLSRCSGLSDLSPLATLSSLKRLDLSECHAITNIEALSALTSLRHLNLDSCFGLTEYNEIAELTALESLRLGSRSAGRHVAQSAAFASLSNVDFLAKFSALKALDLCGLAQLADFSFLRSLTGLTRLNLKGCASLEDLSVLSHAVTLESLNLMKCEGLKNIGPLSTLPALKVLDLKFCAGMTDLSPLGTLTELTKLELYGLKKLTDVTFLESLGRLEILNLAGCRALSDISSISSLKNLRHLNLNLCGKILDLSALSSLTKLERLAVEGSNAPSLPSLADLGSLTYLALGGKSLESLPALCQNSVLQTLRAVRVPALTDVTALSTATQLQKLRLTGAESLNDISPLARATDLTSLALSNAPISDTTALRDLEKLSRLYLADCQAIADFDFISKLTALESLELTRCDGLTNLSSIQGISGLKELDVSASKNLNDLTGLEALSQLETLNISDCPELTDSLRWQPIERLPLLRSLQGSFPASFITRLLARNAADAEDVGFTETHLSDWAETAQRSPESPGLLSAVGRAAALTSDGPAVIATLLELATAHDAPGVDGLFHVACARLDSPGITQAIDAAVKQSEGPLPPETLLAIHQHAPTLWTLRDRTLLALQRSLASPDAPDWSARTAQALYESLSDPRYPLDAAVHETVATALTGRQFTALEQALYGALSSDHAQAADSDWRDEFHATLLALGLAQSESEHRNRALSALASGLAQAGHWGADKLDALLRAAAEVDADTSALQAAAARAHALGGRWSASDAVLFSIARPAVRDACIDDLLTLLISSEQTDRARRAVDLTAALSDPWDRAERLVSLGTSDMLLADRIAYGRLVTLLAENPDAQLQVVTAAIQANPELATAQAPPSFGPVTAREHRLVTAWRAAITAVVPDLLDAIEQRLSERNT